MAKKKKDPLVVKMDDNGYIPYKMYQIEADGIFMVKLMAQNEEEAKIMFWDYIVNAFHSKIQSASPEAGGLMISNVEEAKGGLSEYIRGDWKMGG